MNDVHEQLAETFRGHEHLTPDPAAVMGGIRAGTVRAGRRRLVAAVASAAAVIAVLVAVPLVAPKQLGGSDPEPPAKPPITSYRDATLKPGWLPAGTAAAEREHVEAGRRYTEHYTEGKGIGDRIVLAMADTEKDAYFDDGPQERPLARAELVDVNGRPGAYRWDERDYPRPSGHGTRKYLLVHVTWKASNGLWASVNVSLGRGGTNGGLDGIDRARVRAEVLRIARAARVQAAALPPAPRLRYPFTVGYLPAAVRENGRLLDTSVDNFAGEGNWNSSFRMSLDGTRRSGWNGAASPGLGLYEYSRNQLVNLVQIDVIPGGHPGMVGPGDVQVNGRPAKWAASGVGLTIYGGQNGAPEVAVWGDLPKAELLRIAEGIRLVDHPERYETWVETPLR